jgi:hypothetical protein
MNPENKLLDVARRYVAAVESLTALLREQLGVTDLLGAVNASKIPREGKLADGAEYSFHGVGCLVDDGKVSVDFDFGPNGRSDGFDAWRLKNFADQVAPDSGFDRLESMEAALSELERQGVVCNPRWPPSKHLYYFTDALSCEQDEGHV